MKNKTIKRKKEKEKYIKKAQQSQFNPKKGEIEFGHRNDKFLK